MRGVLAVLEARENWNRASWEALAAAQEIAGRVGEPLMAAVAGASLDAQSTDLAARRLDRAFAVRHDILAQYTADGYTTAFEQLIRHLDPAYVLFPHTYQVRDFAPKLAARFSQTLIADVPGFHWDSGKPVFVRQLLQGKLNGDYLHSGGGPCFASLQAGAFRADALEPGSCTVEVFAPQLDILQIRSKPEERFRAASRTVDLASAALIVSVGRGIQDQDNLPLVEELAAALGAELAASRPICDNGWLPMERQVGSSGQTVSPKVYLAVGISGAIQHLVGMKGSKTIIAINRDENAPIFEVADYGIVGDLFEVVPRLTDAVNKLKGA